MKTLRRKLNNRKGVTLVELIVSVALLAIFCLCCSVLVRPCAAAFDSMQKTARAQMIGDSIIEGLRAELMTARGTIRFTTAADDTDAEVPFAVPANYSVASGTALEFRTTGDYFEMIDAGYVPVTKKETGESLVDATAAKTTVGRLHMRYFTRKTDTNSNTVYAYSKKGAYQAYDYTTAYTEKFYMNNYIKLNFAGQGYTRDNIGGTFYIRVNSVRVDLSVYNEKGELVHSQSAILDLPNAPALVQTADQFAPRAEP